MASLPEIKISQNEYRPCFVNDKKALFHKWNDFANTIGDSLAVGGHTAGQIKYTLGLVEYEDGTVAEVVPYDIKFTDNKMKEYDFREE